MATKPCTGCSRGRLLDAAGAVASLDPATSSVMGVLHTAQGLFCHSASSREVPFLCFLSFCPICLSHLPPMPAPPYLSISPLGELLPQTLVAPNKQWHPKPDSHSNGNFLLPFPLFFWWDRWWVAMLGESFSLLWGIKMVHNWFSERLLAQGSPYWLSAATLRWVFVCLLLF